MASGSGVAMDVGNDDQETNKNRGLECSRVSRSNQKKFPEIPTMTWEELFELQSRSSPCGTKKEELYSNVETRPRNLILVDVRTPTEFQVSTIPGAVSLQQFEKEIIPSVSSDVKVVTFCTIGFRSGLEARRLLNIYPERITRENIFHLEGIVSYTHSQNTSSKISSRSIVNNSSKIASTSHDTERKSFMPLICPHTGEPTRRVHTFSKTWDYTNEGGLNHEGFYYQPVYFPKPVFMINMAKSVCRTIYVQISVWFSQVLSSKNSIM